MACATSWPPASEAVMSNSAVITEPGRMSGDELRAWQDAMKYTQEQAAAALILSLRGYQHYLGEERPIFGPVPLACCAVSFGLRWTRGMFLKP